MTADDHIVLIVDDDAAELGISGEQPLVIIIDDDVSVREALSEPIRTWETLPAPMRETGAI